MRRIILLTLIVLAAIAIAAQTNRFPAINLYVGDPTGKSCVIANTLVQSTTNGQIFSCISGVYVGASGVSIPVPLASGGTNATNAAAAAVNLVNGNPIQPSTVTNSSINGTINVKAPPYNAAGNGATDDTAALSSALTAALITNQCLVFPAGIYKTTAQLTWTSQQRLCIRGRTPQTSYILYQGTSSITAALVVATGSGTGVQFDIDGMGFAANANAVDGGFYSYLACCGTTTNNVAFAGGSSSAVRNDFFNSQGDQRNWQVGTGFTPSGSSPCVNGITFGPGSSSYGQSGDPSSQFTFTMVQLRGGCSGTALNLLSTNNVTFNNGQINCNGQQLFLGDQNNVPSSGNTFNTVLLENCSNTTLPVQIYGLNNVFTSLGESDLAGTPSGSEGIYIYGSKNSFKGGYFTPKIQAPSSCSPAMACAAFANDFDTNVFNSTIGPTDAGIGKTGRNNSLDNGGFLTYTLDNAWNIETPTDSTSLIGSPAYTQAPVHVPWNLTTVGNGVYPITAALKLESPPNYFRAYIDGGFVQNAATTGTAQSYEVNNFSNSVVTLVDGTTITFANNQTDGNFEATVANNTDPVSFSGWVTIFPGGLTGGGMAPYAVQYNSAVNLNGGVAINGNTILDATLTGNNGNSSGTKIPRAIPWTGSNVGQPICPDVNGNLTVSACTGATAGVSSINSTAGAFTFSFSGGAGSCSGTTCTFTGSGSGGGSVTNFIANSGSWPSWLTPSVATSTTTPTLSVTATTGLTGNEFLATPCGTTGAVILRILCNGDLPTTMTGITIDGVTPTTMGYLDATSSIQSQFNLKAPLASPALTGTPTAPTQSCASNTDIATGAYVANCSGVGSVTDSTGTTTPLQFAESTSSAHVIQYRTPTQALGDMGAAPAIGCTTVSSLSPANNGCYQLSTSSSVAMPSASAFTIFVVQTESGATATFTGTTLSSNAGCSAYLSGSTLALTGNHAISVKSDGTNIWASCI